MTLPAADRAYLSGLGIEYQIEPESGMTCVVLRSWPLPVGFSQPAVDLLVRLAPGYPDVPPDMWWFSPAVHMPNGTELPNTSVYEDYLGRRWQRWSRHLRPDQWRSGMDGLENYVTLIRNELQQSVPELAR